MTWLAEDETTGYYDLMARHYDSSGMPRMLF